MFRNLAAALLLAAATHAVAQSVATPSAAQPAAKPAAAPATAPMPPHTILADDGVVHITRADYDLELQKLPPDLRPGFAANETRVAELITRLLVTRALAHEAETKGLTREPGNVARLAAEVEKMKAQLRVAQIEAEAAERFEGEREAWEKRARELHATQPARFVQPEQVVASHILFRTQGRTQDEAIKLAKDARDKIVAGTAFGKLAAEVSEDPQSRRMLGRLPPVARGGMEPAFEAAAFALRKGELSEPVVTPFGVHLIFAHDHTPERMLTFEQARPALMADFRQKYVAAARDEALNAMQVKARDYLNVEAVRTMIVAPPTEQEMSRLQREAGGRPARPGAK